MRCKCRYEIFISSTFEDLKKERGIVINEINKMGHIPIAMELFYAENKAPWEVIKEKIMSCDYYILIISDRYGSICEEAGNGNSYTHEEFLLARELHKPILIILRSKESIKELPEEYRERIYGKELEEFRELTKGYLSSYWADKSDLGMTFQSAMNKEISTEPQRGWIRGIVPEILNLRKDLNEEKPIIYLVGADSVGKSTIALRLKNRYNLDSVVGVDVLRNGIGGLLKSQQLENSEITHLLTSHTSSLSQIEIDKRSEILFDPIIAMVDRLHHKKYSAIIEGVDISPNLLFEQHRVSRKFDIVINVCMKDEDEHMDRYNRRRASNTEGHHQDSIEEFRKNIRVKQEKLIEDIEMIRKNKYFQNKKRIHKFYNLYNDGEIEEILEEIDKILFSLNNKKRSR